LMTKAEAIKKISKLNKLAEKAGTPQEAETARRAAEDLRRKHSISERELQLRAKAAAFDDLVGRLDAYARTQSQLPAPVFEVLSKIKSDTKEEDKANVLEKVVNMVRVGALLLSRKSMGPVKEIVEETIRRHGLTI